MNEEHAERYLKKMLAIIKGPPGTHQERIDALFVRIKARLSDLETMAEKLEESEEDGVYRFYDGSYKAFHMQEPVKKAFKLIEEIGVKTIRCISNMRSMSRPERKTILRVIAPTPTGMRRLSRF